MTLRDPLAFILLGFVALSFLGLLGADIFGPVGPGVSTPESECLLRTAWLVEHFQYGPWENCR
jgi:hypothetical protein